MIRGYNAQAVALAHMELDPRLAKSTGVTTAVTALDVEGDLEVGVWEHSVGQSTDTEVEEVFVVIFGKGTVTCDQGGTIELVPGTIGILPSGARTTWTVSETLRKVWVTLA